jgi:hypothetical protein
VREQLQRILSSPAFQNSKRYAAVLKYVVEQTLEGAGALLKERSIGIDIFARTPDYDTASDHVVRSAIAEVRKRLAQYYQTDPVGELRIELLPGCYTPQFRYPDSLPNSSVVAANKAPKPPLPLLVDLFSAPANQPGRLRTMAVMGGLLVLLAGLAILFAWNRHDDALDSFWRPVLSSREPVLLCVGNLAAGKKEEGANTSLSPSLDLGGFHSSETELIHVYDAITLARFAGFIQAHGKQIRLQSQSDATFTDLQNGPAILVGLMNNSWSERLISKLRYTVDQTSPSEYVIRDRNDPSKKDWSIDYAVPYLNVTRDYAIVLRMVDPKTEQMVVVAAGMTVFGTQAAGKFLTNKNEMRKLAAAAPPGWEKKNMEFVLSTDVIRGRSGPANVVAVQCW